MNVLCIGGGAAGLYLSILLKKADPRREITVFERNRLDDTFGFGVVFSDATLDTLQAADAPTFAQITDAFKRWDDVDVHYRGSVISSTGHGFAGLSRQTLLQILAARCETLGVDLRFETDIRSLTDCPPADLVVGADGFNSIVRNTHAESFKPTIDWRSNKFVWLGTTQRFNAFTFYFKQNEHGLWRVHAYQYDSDHSTFIVECTKATWEATGLREDDEDATITYCERLFAEELGGHCLLRNRSIWRNFPTITNECWHHQNVVLLGDAVHTAHFSVGSGTKLAMEDSIELAAQLTTHGDLEEALTAYEDRRRPSVESLQRAAQVSLEWFESTERYLDLDPLQFAFSLLTRSLRITHENLRLRDPAFIGAIDQWFAENADGAKGNQGSATAPPPPVFVPYTLRDMTLVNRVVVSPMCQYSAVDGVPNDWHLVHLGARALGGAGLVFTEMTNVSPEGRISHGCTGMYDPSHVSAWQRIVRFVHQNSQARIGIQLGHAGRKGSTTRPWEGEPNQRLERNGWPIIAPSPLPFASNSDTPRAMDRHDMDEVREQFVRAARMADAAGFDIIEVHCAHGYLLSSFVSPLTNHRGDEYGGSLTNRMRFPLEVLDAIRAAWPDHKPLAVRISAVDWVPSGMQAEDAVEVARMLKDHDCDIVDVSAGQTVAEARPTYGRQFQTPFSERIKHEARIPTMAVGNISSYEDVNTILAAGRADLCVLARAHLWDPYWTRHAAYELGYPLSWPPPYSALDEYTPRFT